MDTTLVHREPTIVDQIVASFPKKEICQRILLVAAVGCSILSITPSFRIGAAIAMRGIALISSLASFHHINPQNQISVIAQNVARCAIIILGIVAIATASPLLLIVSLIMDTAMQAFLCLKALYKQDFMGVALHFGMLAINTLAVAALITGSWQLMVAAAAASALAMASIALLIAFYAQKDDLGTAIDIACYLALTITGSVAITQMLPAAATIEKRVLFKATNPHERFDTRYIDCNGNQVANPAPHESQDVLLRPEDTFSGNRLEYRVNPMGGGFDGPTHTKFITGEVTHITIPAPKPNIPSLIPLLPNLGGNPTSLTPLMKQQPDQLKFECTCFV